MDLLTVSLPDGTDVAGSEDYVLDLSFGDSGNTFEVYAPELPLKPGCLISIDGTEYGGIIDSASDTLSGGFSSTTWSGRTWHGILATKILVPDGDYINIAATPKDAIVEVISRANLGSMFKPGESSSRVRITCQLPRFCDAYTALRKIADAAGSRLKIQRADGKTLVWLEPNKEAKSLDSDVLDYKSKTSFHPVNHLICAGKGELANRTVLHFYADKKGNVSRTQTLFGNDEVAMFYDYNNAEDGELAKEGAKKLKELQAQSSVDVTVHDGLDLQIDDVVVAENQDTGRRTQATIGKKVVKVANGVMSVSYEVTSPNVANGSSGAAFESSGGGGSNSAGAYVAGSGISIVGNRISATMSAEKVAILEEHISSAQSAAVEAQSKAYEAREIGNSALASANNRVEAIETSGPINASRTGSTVTLSVGASGVSKGTYGQASNVVAAAGSSFVVPQIVVDEFGRVVGASQATISIPSSQQAGASGGFLAAHPVGTVYESTKSTNPASFGGTWKRLPSVDGFKWERTA